MKLKRLPFFYTLVLSGSFLAMVIPGLRNECVPNNKIARESFFGLREPAKNYLIKEMDDFKAWHRELVNDNLYQDVMWQFLPPKDYLRDMLKEDTIIIEGKKIYISKNKMRWLSNNIMSPSVWDEQNVFRMFYRFNPSKLDFNPHYFRYGGAWLYPVGFSLFIASKLGIFKLVKDIAYYMHQPQDILLISALGKGFGIFCFLISLLILYYICRRFYARRVFIFASFFTIFCPLIIVESVHLKPLLSAAMWYLLAVFCCFNILENDKIRINAIYAGICAGLAAGSLLSTVAVLLPIFLSLTYNRIFPFKEIKSNLLKTPFVDLKYFVWSVLLCIAIFFITNPYTIVSYKEFIRELIWNVKDYRSLYSFWDMSIHLGNIRILFDSLGWPLGSIVLISIIWAIINNRQAKKRIILFSIFGYYFLTYSTCFAIGTLHALVPILPLLILLSTDFMDSLFNQKKIHKFIIFGLIGLVAIYTFLNSLFYAFIFTRTPRLAAGEWINRNIPEGSSIGTFIDNCGLSNNYPYFNYFLYKFVNDTSPDLSQIKEKLPQYYILVNSYEPKSIASSKDNIAPEYIKYIDKTGTRGTHFHWVLKLNEEKEIAPYYKEVVRFDSRVPLLDRIFKNTLIFWWIKEIKIYELR
ncbi:MAG: hypothetical protein HZA27_03765 [Candidatus Omnitrophica bacterium]|nr:hypothetical protein [Candidatus Omnitrophota bacterium]